METVEPALKRRLCEKKLKRMKCSVGRHAALFMMRLQTEIWKEKYEVVFVLCEFGKGV